VLPIRDNVPSRRFPAATVLLIAANALVFLYQISLSPLAEAKFVYRFGVIPAAVQQVLNGEPGLYDVHIGRGLRSYVLALPVDLFHVGRSFLAGMFLHGGFLHILGNMWFLWIFGDNVEDRMGRARFVAFYLLCGLGASAVHVATNFDSDVPTIGASGAIAGVLGAYFVMFPRARVLTLVPIFLFASFYEIPAFVFLGIWFLIQLFSTGQASDGAGVAFWAHVGGFVLGIVLLPLFRWRALEEG
jgi:membrane associated rhomboid family serine protease